MKTLLIFILLCKVCKKASAAATKHFGVFRGTDTEQQQPFTEFKLAIMNNASSHDPSNDGSRQVVNPTCTYPDYYCNPTGPDLIRKVENIGVDNASECLALCKM